MYVEDLVEVLQTNLITTKKRYTHGRHRVQLHLWLQLACFTANRPQALLDLCYRHIIVTLLYDLEGGPHHVLLEFTFEFTKQYLGLKDWYVFLRSINPLYYISLDLQVPSNTFPIPEIIYDPSLILSPHAFLLGLIFADRAFKAPNLTSPKQLAKLYVEPGRNELPLPL